MTNHPTYYPTPNHPIRDVLKALTGKQPPAFVCGIDFRGLTDAQYGELQDWCSCNAKPSWATGFGLEDAACTIVAAAISNGNIDNRGLDDVQYSPYDNAMQELARWRMGSRGRAFHVHVTEKTATVTLGYRGREIAEFKGPSLFVAMNRARHASFSKPKKKATK